MNITRLRQLIFPDTDEGENFLIPGYYFFFDFILILEDPYERLYYKQETPVTHGRAQWFVRERCICTGKKNYLIFLRNGKILKQLA